ncbi:Uncharacterized protein APZ42_022438 [Daphnia magna]|uniref:Uncharacterized protein n=1 Tax=Daphnia magna TaxID=35525 RepID=A0A164VI73_9CRUS|nr:Uncharacterized protein APZ42_022438 [Daphnia magna]
MISIRNVLESTIASRSIPIHQSLNFLKNQIKQHFKCVQQQQKIEFKTGSIQKY